MLIARQKSLSFILNLGHATVINNIHASARAWILVSSYLSSLKKALMFYGEFRACMSFQRGRSTPLGLLW